MANVSLLCSHYSAFLKCAAFVMRVQNYRCSEDTIQQMALNNYWHFTSRPTSSDWSSHPPMSQSHFPSSGGFPSSGDFPSSSDWSSHPPMSQSHFPTSRAFPSSGNFPSSSDWSSRPPMSQSHFPSSGDFPSSSDYSGTMSDRDTATMDPSSSSLYGSTDHRGTPSDQYSSSDRYGTTPELYSSFSDHDSASSYHGDSSAPSYSDHSSASDYGHGSYKASLPYICMGELCNLLFFHWCKWNQCIYDHIGFFLSISSSILDSFCFPQRKRFYFLFSPFVSPYLVIAHFHWASFSGHRLCK